MQIVADFHIHSKYSRATSKDMDIEHLNRGAKLKGLQLIGTGDFTHPLWLEELKGKLKGEVEGIFKYEDVYFILTGEISTIFESEGKIKKVHHVIHAPSFEIVDQINEALKKFGNLESDGRPTLNVSAPEMTELIMEINPEIFIYPSHAWTPWFSVFGSKSGFDSLQECYQDQSKYIHALETGLSSDPAMNWRLSALDKFALLSNSDSHSANSWRLGREANVFDLEEVNYKEIHDAIKKKDEKRFLFTIETDPNYGKYHFDGHRNCNFSCNPDEAKKFNNFCPVCKRKLTIGVLHRVDDLADRSEGFIPKDAIPFKTLLPLYEIISHVLGINQLYSQKVIQQQDKLIEKFGNELNILLNVERKELLKVCDEKIVEAIIKTREGKVKYVAGYDGVYGEPIFDESKMKKRLIVREQKSLKDFD